MNAPSALDKTLFIVVIGDGRGIRSSYPGGRKAREGPGSRFTRRVHRGTIDCFDERE